jgi:hypothetical protein
VNMAPPAVTDRSLSLAPRRANRRLLLAGMTLAAPFLLGACTSASNTGTGTQGRGGTNPGSTTLAAPLSSPGSINATDAFPSDPTVPDSSGVGDSVGADNVPTSAQGDQLAVGTAFVLQENGVDEVHFGDDLGSVRETLIARHGEPDDDSGWFDQQSPCDGLGTKVRTLTWGNLVLEFSNGPTRYGPGDSEHLIAYYSADEQGSGGIVGPDNAAILDQTVATLRQRFPGATFVNSEIAGPEYHLPNNIAGSLTGLSDSDTSQTFRNGLVCID